MPLPTFTMANTRSSLMISTAWREKLDTNSSNSASSTVGPNCCNTMPTNSELLEFSYLPTTTQRGAMRRTDNHTHQTTCDTSCHTRACEMNECTALARNGAARLEVGLTMPSRC